MSPANFHRHEIKMSRSVTKCHEVEAFGFGGWQASEELTSAKLRCGPEGWVMQNLGVIS